MIALDYVTTLPDFLPSSVKLTLPLEKKGDACSLAEEGILDVTLMTSDFSRSAADHNLGSSPRVAWTDRVSGSPRGIPGLNYDLIAAFVLGKDSIEWTNKDAVLAQGN